MKKAKSKMKSNNAKFKEDIKKRVYVYAINVIKLLDSLDEKKVSTQALSRQLVRSATSVGANVIEAQAGSSKKDFTNFLTHALKSANESKFWLGLLRDTKKASASSVNDLLKETEELAKILASSILTLKGKK